LLNLKSLNRVTNICNSLREKIVTSPCVNSFKNKLDKHWHNQELVYNWQTGMIGTRRRSHVLS